MDCKTLQAAYGFTFEYCDDSSGYASYYDLTHRLGHGITDLEGLVEFLGFRQALDEFGQGCWFMDVLTANGYRSERQVCNYGPWFPPPGNMRFAGMLRMDGQSDTGGNRPPIPWQDWPQAKRDKAVGLLTPSDWSGLTNNMPSGLTLQPGDTLDTPTIILPGLPLDDPTTPQDERLPKVIPGPWTIPYPDLAPTPSPSPSPSPSPEPTPPPPTNNTNPPPPDAPPPNNNNDSPPPDAPPPNRSSDPSPKNGSNGEVNKFPNTLPETLKQELNNAARLGVTPVEVGTPKFDEIINSGEKIKWAVTQEGKLLVVPHTIQTIEISHAVISGGEPVLAAGEANIAGDTQIGYYLLEIDNRSGHFQPSSESIQIGIDAFKASGVQTSNAQISTVNPGR